MKKRLPIISIFLIISTFMTRSQIILENSKNNKPLYAKFAPIENLDRSILECIYEYNIVDKNLQETKSYYDILQIGNNYSKYFAYPSYKIDSVIYKKDINKITMQEASQIYARYGSQDNSPYTVIKNSKNKNLEYYDRIFSDYYVYLDAPSFQWKIEKEKKAICGYTCQKATTSFRGREWTAYYAIDIPKNDGPWKFSGLPGLILRIEDKNKEHVFTAISIRNSKNDIYLEKKNSRFKTKREQFNKQLNAFKTNPGKVISGSQLAPKDPITGKETKISKRKMFYNPIELE